MRAVEQNNTIASRPGIITARSVGINCHVFHITNELRIRAYQHGAAEPQSKHVGIGIDIAIGYRSLKGDLGD
jgi:hypothetical protein